MEFSIQFCSSERVDPTDTLEFQWKRKFFLMKIDSLGHANVSGYHNFQVVSYAFSRLKKIPSEAAFFL